MGETALLTLRTAEELFHCDVCVRSKEGTKDGREVGREEGRKKIVEMFRTSTGLGSNGLVPQVHLAPQACSS